MKIYHKIHRILPNDPSEYLFVKFIGYIKLEDVDEPLLIFQDRYGTYLLCENFCDKQEKLYNHIFKQKALNCFVIEFSYIARSLFPVKYNGIDVYYRGQIKEDSVMYNVTRRDVHQITI